MNENTETEMTEEQQESTIEDLKAEEQQESTIEDLNAEEQQESPIEDQDAEEQQESTIEDQDAEEQQESPIEDLNADNEFNSTMDEGSEDIEPQEPEKPRNPNAKWYILQAYAGYETRVEKTINEKLRIKGLEDFVDEIFIPSEDIVRTKDGKKRKVNQKYFPGYILISMELTPDLWHLLMGVDRVSGFIGGTQRDPLPLDERELVEIREKINEGFQQQASEDEFIIGQKVTITEGSFSNFSGSIDEINTERRKLKVLVSIFGRPTPVEIEFEKVKHVVE